MHGGVRVNYAETMCALLHDIGKVFQRYKRRSEEGLERQIEIEELRKILDEMPRDIEHERIGVEVVREATGKTVDLEVCELFRRAIPYADVVAAAERGLGSYLHLGSIWGKIEEDISRKLGLRYNHAYTPLLSPLWIARETGYTDAIGPCAGKPYSADTALDNLRQTLSDILLGLEKGDADRISSSLAQLIGRLVNEPLWIPPRPLKLDEILGLKTYDYKSAQKLTDYAGISESLYNGLKLVSGLYKRGVTLTRGYVDTVGELLRFTLLAVPAAVYMALLPDTSLYSHSKLVTAYTAALSTGTEKFRILVVDARGIQNFVAAPVVVKAASRVIRGRSFLVELILASLVNYILELYGGLPSANVVTSEGGTSEIIVPALNPLHESKLMETITRVVRATYERLRGLWITLAISREFDLDDVDFVRNIKECKREEVLKCPGFFELEENLARNLAQEKARDEVLSALRIDETNIEGFDAITKEPVTRADLTDWFGLKVTDTLKDYAMAISGGKLEVGDLVCETTHLSLVAGSALRNLTFLLSIYLYRQLEDTPTPASDEVVELLDVLKKRIGDRFKIPAVDEQLFFGNLEYRLELKTVQEREREVVEYMVIPFDVAFVPLPTLGALHVMISARTPTPAPATEPSPEELEKALSVAISELERASAEMVALLLGMIHDELAKLITERKCRIRVEVRTVNKGVEFIDVLRMERLSKTIEMLLKDKIDVHIGTIHTGTHHPSTPEGLVDLDAYNLIAMVKADADILGEVRKLLSFSPTRLSALSDYLTTVVNCKTNILASKITAEYAHRLQPRGAIILYAGGDDVAFYGYWVDVLLMLGKFYSDVVSALYPLSFTSAAAIERSDYPLLELYSKVVKVLEDGKEEARGWVFLSDISTAKPVLCVDGKVKLTSGMQPSGVGVYSVIPAVKLTGPLELFESLITTIEKLEKSAEVKSKLAEYKRELMIVLRIAALNGHELSVLMGLLTGSETSRDYGALYNLTRRLVALSYTSARRKDNYERLTDLLKNLVGITAKIHHEVGEDVVEAMRRAVSSKTFIDVLVLYLNPYSTEIRK